jgi:hypothetical protein
VRVRNTPHASPRRGAGRGRVRGVIAIFPAVAVCGVAGVGVAAAVGGTTDPNGDRSIPGKAAAIASATPPSEEEVRNLLASIQASASVSDDNTKGLRPGTTAKQLGTTTTPRLAGASIKAIGAIAENYVTRDYALLAAPGSEAGRRSALDDPHKVPAVQAEVTAIWIPAKASARIADVMENLRLQANDSSMLTFDSVNLHVDAGSVTAASDGTTVAVTFTGHFSHHLASTNTWENENRYAWTVILTKASHARWQMSDVQQSPYADGPTVAATRGSW